MAAGTGVGLIGRERNVTHSSMYRAIPGLESKSTTLIVLVFSVVRLHIYQVPGTLLVFICVFVYHIYEVYEVSLYWTRNHQNGQSSVPRLNARDTRDRRPL